MTTPSPIPAPALDDRLAKGGFFTRRGGVSGGIYKGLNVGLGSNDQREAVLENRRRVAAHLGVEAAALLSPYQIHSNEVLVATGPWEAGDRPRVDGLVTNRPEIAIGILTADCGPVLFIDQEHAVIGAAHAGWKGATGGVLENTLVEMEKLGARRDTIHATLGPTISAANYEVGPEFVDRLLDLDAANDRFLASSQNEGHAMFDLPAYILDRLHGAGVEAEWTGQCTYAGEEEFFSYRRTTHRGEPDYGRQISAIRLLEEGN